jgi:hypothetical protein
VDDTKEFGQNLADRIYCSVRDQGISSAQAATLFLEKAGERARQLEAEGKSGSEIGAWVEAVAVAYGTRIEELTR